MPDLTIQAFWHCQSAEDFQATVESRSGGQPHVVRLDRHSHKGSKAQCDWSCDCKGYKVRGRCSHIAQVQKEGRRCGWLQFIDGGEVSHDAEGRPVCPRCGLPATARGWAV